MRLVKVSANNIRPGMFIAELDRPWLETPFALQGFIVRDEAEVDFISLYVDYVYVDVEYAGSKVFLPLQAQDKNSEAATLNNRLAIKADFQQAQTSFK
ncbi:MAG: DUF3391 domain-containing protein, partial [Cellvibrionaceae bacterium]|nr:DUF3391 domain-containing protein [Cellvibrionaceae bacterium]